MSRVQDTNIGFITIGENRYPMEMLSPIDAIDWGNRVFLLAAPVLGGIADFTVDNGATFREALGELDSRDLTKLMKDAYKRCYTPKNEPLSNEAVFNEWFRANKGDLYELGLRAVIDLSKDFFPSQLATVVSELQDRIQQMSRGQASPFRADGQANSLPDA